MDLISVFTRNWQTLAVPKDTPLRLGLSGGVSSVVLLDLISQLPDTQHMTAVHINHRIRPEARQDEVFCKNLAAQYEMDFQSVSFDVPGLSAASKESVETTGRRVRYQELCKEGAFAVVAHHFDDQLETVFMNLKRGAGIRGLAGMRPRQMDKRGTVLRPLLSIPKKELLAYASQKGLTWREDTTNQDTLYTRNQVRAWLQQHPEAREDIKALAHQAFALEAELAHKLTPMLTEGRTSQYEWSLSLLCALPKELLSEWFVWLWVSQRGGAEGLSKKMIGQLVDLVYRPTPGGKIDLPDQWHAARSQTNLYFGPHPKNAVPQTVALGGPGTYPWYDDLVVLEEIETPLHQRDPHCVELPADKIQGTLTVRTRKSGDRYMPLGLRGRKSLQDLWVDQKIPSYLRNTWPVLCDRKGIVWTPHCPPAERMRSKKTRALRVHFVRR